MPYNNTTGEYTVSTPEQVWQMYYDAHKNQNGYAGTIEEFRQGKYGALAYAAMQLYIRSEVETSLIYEWATDFYRRENALIETNNLNPQGIRDAFKSELGLDVALDMAGLGFSIAIDYTPEPTLNAEIARLLATECYAYDDPSLMQGDIQQAHQSDSSSQSFVMKWRQKQDAQVKFKLVITHIAETPAPILTKDEILKLFLEKWNERYIWGNKIQPQRIISVCDLPFATTVQVLHDGGTGGEPLDTSPLTLEYFKKAIPIITANEIQVTVV